MSDDLGAGRGKKITAMMLWSWASAMACRPRRWSPASRAGHRPPDEALIERWFEIRPVADLRRRSRKASYGSAVSQSKSHGALLEEIAGARAPDIPVSSRRVA